MNVVKHIISIYILLLLIACTSSKPIASNKFKGFSEIKQGEIATIEWDFANANHVRVESYDKLYKPIDSVKVSPNKTREYKITAFHESDTVAYKWTVAVTDNKEELAVTQPPAEQRTDQYMPQYSPNTFNSEYINGTIGPEAAPVRIKIMQVKRKKDQMELNTIILDENGNFINGLNSEVVDLSFIQTCQKSSTSSGNLHIDEVHNTEGTDYSIVFDNSAVAEFNFPILDRILNFSENISSKDRLSFSYFNQNYNEYIPLTPQLEFFETFKGYDLPKPDGLSAPYKALYSNLLSFTPKLSKDKNKAIILLTYSEDNSSLIYSPEDIISAAQNFGVPIYVIGIGDAINSYNLKKIANATGGKLYSLHSDSLHSVESIMKEIDFALNNHYSIPLEIDADNDECSDSYGKLILKYGERTVEDGIVMNTTNTDYHSYYQSVALFDQNSSELSTTYADNVLELANVLKNNTDYKVMLIGHSGDEGTKEQNAEVSEKRAETVKQSLIEAGVNEEQLITRSEGFAKPLYILGQTPWQKNFNRRVELKWINPNDNPPFEIIVEQVWTEEEALTATDKWTKRGFKSYYKNYLIGNEPVYRVVLWGFASESEVKQVASNIMKKYKTTVTYK